MRKLFIKLLAFDYFFKLFGKAVQIPRIVVASFVTLSVGVSLSGIEMKSTDILYFIPFFIINLISMFYFKYFPVTFKDWELLSLGQKYLAFQRIPEFNGDFANEEILDEYYNKVIPKMDYKYGDLEEAGKRSMYLFLFGLFTLGVLYMFLGSLV